MKLYCLRLSLLHRAEAISFFQYNATSDHTADAKDGCVCVHLRCKKMGEKVRIITTHLPSGDEPKKEVHRTSILWRQVFYSLMTSLHVWLKGRTSVCAPWGCHCQANSRVTVPGVGKNRMQNQISCFPGTDNIYMVILHCRTSLLPGYVLAAGWPSAVPSEQRRRGLTCMMHLDRLYLACIFLFVPV